MPHCFGLTAGRLAVLPYIVDDLLAWRTDFVLYPFIEYPIYPYVYVQLIFLTNMTQDYRNPTPQLISPEHETEAALLQDQAFQEGLLWGVPRFGHPEGKIYKHILEVLDNIDRLKVSAPLRRKLRLIALVHDTFKYREVRATPRDWSKHHGMLARQYMERFTSNQAILDVIELHDEAFYAWRCIFMYQLPGEGQVRLERLLARLGDNLQLFYLFFKCDTETGDKVQAPLRWFEQVVPGIEVLPPLPQSSTR
ncbi:MAG: hypothetical protein RIC19_01700 [Phaeodactylibacter sp.]|uniref:HD domain-containing protein n=1 Tax=Phaeodactylibacter sp. TaxID=1940289 RepID=UPI0032F087D9